MNEINTPHCARRGRALMALAVWCIALTYPSGANANGPLDPEVEAALRERLVLLAEVVKLQQEAYKTGESTLATVFDAMKALNEARIELAKNKEERIEIRKDVLKNAQALEEFVKQMFKMQQATRIDLLNAQAGSLRAKADLIAEQKSGGG